MPAIYEYTNTMSLANSHDVNCWIYVRTSNLDFGGSCSEATLPLAIEYLKCSDCQQFSMGAIMLMCTLKKKKKKIWNSFNRVCKKILHNRDDRMSINSYFLFSCRVVLVFPPATVVFWPSDNCQPIKREIRNSYAAPHDRLIVKMETCSLRHNLNHKYVW